MSNRLFSDSNFDRQFNSVQKTVNRTIGVMILIWGLGVLFSLSLVGVIIWAIVKLVMHFTA